MESNYSGRLCYVSTQPVMIPNSHSFPQPRQDCRLTHGINLDYKKRLEITLLRLVHPENILRELIQPDDVQRNREAIPQARRSQTIHTNWSAVPEDGSTKTTHKWKRAKLWHNSNADICEKVINFEFHNTGGITAEVHGRSAKTANFRAVVRQIPQSTVVCVKNSSQKSSHFLF